MSERYQKVFSHVTITDFDDEYITNSESNFESTLSKMQNFSTICHQNSSNYESYARELSILFGNMNKVGKVLIGQEEIVILREECINPYKIIQEWLTNEIYEVQGILNAIKSRERIGKMRAKAESQVNENQVAYDKVASGKKTLMQKLKGQSEEEIKNHLQEVLLECKHEVEMIRITEKIINNRLAKLEIPFFKKTRSFHFNKIMKAFLSAHNDEFNSIITQSKRMLYIHNNK